MALQVGDLIPIGGKSKDEIPPPPITNFNSSVDGASISLTWTNPNDTDFVGVRIQRKEGGYPSSETDGVTVYEGNSQLFTDDDINRGTVQYYRAFTFDFDDNFQTDTGQQTNNIVKLTQSAPSSPTLSNRTSTSITLNIISGCEYSLGGSNWQDSNVFSGLSIATSYTFYARRKETSTHYASPNSTGSSFTTDKGTQSPPSAPTISNLEFDRATVNGGSGTEVNINNGAWFDSPHTFTGLTAETSYTAYSRKKETTTHYASLSASKDFTTLSELDDQSGSPGSPNLIAGNKQAGYFGAVPSSEFITGDALANLVGLSVGRSQHSTTDWLKFAYEGKILFSPMKPIRYGLSWDDINLANAVFGGKTVTIKGLQFKVRLWKGAQNDPSNYTDVDRDAIGSEWNKLILPIHENAPNNWAYPDYGGISEDWGINLSDADLLVYANAAIDGTYSWCQETNGDDTSRRIYRGRYGVSYLFSTPAAYNSDVYGWRPVLELL